MYGMDLIWCKDVYQTVHLCCVGFHLDAQDLQTKANQKHNNIHWLNNNFTRHVNAAQASDLLLCLLFCTWATDQNMQPVGSKQRRPEYYII